MGCKTKCQYTVCKKGKTGPTGPTGPPGTIGATGAAGATGATGASSLGLGFLEVFGTAATASPVGTLVGVNTDYPMPVIAQNATTGTGSAWTTADGGITYTLGTTASGGGAGKYQLFYSLPMIVTAVSTTLLDEKISSRLTKTSAGTPVVLPGSDSLFGRATGSSLVIPIGESFKLSRSVIADFLVGDSIKLNTISTATTTGTMTAVVQLGSVPGSLQAPTPSGALLTITRIV